MAKHPASVMPHGPGHRAVYFVGSNGTLRYYVPGSPGPVAHYRFAPDGEGMLIILENATYWIALPSTWVRLPK